MNSPSPFTDLIEKWPAEAGKSALATFSDDLGVPYPTAGAWKQRKSIPAEQWPALIEAARKRGLDLTLELLHEWRATTLKAAS